jgi:hypothetical protein
VAKKVMSARMMYFMLVEKRCKCCVCEDESREAREARFKEKSMNSPCSKITHVKNQKFIALNNIYYYSTATVTTKGAPMTGIQ